MNGKAQQMTQLNNKIKIEIWSDVVCPFCYVGKKKLEQAINKLDANDKVEIIWRSFQLDPNFPKNEAIPSTQYLVQKRGYPADQVNAMSNNLKQQATQYGIDFNFENAQTFNTEDVHRLLHWAKSSNKTNELKEALMKAYFTDGKNLSLNNEILQVVASVGLDKNEALKILESSKFTEEVQMDIYMAQQVGARGVPFFVFNNKPAISGAQDDKVFEQAISSFLSEITPLVQGEGAACEPSGECK